MKKFRNVALALLGVLSIWFLGCTANASTSGDDDNDFGISITLPGKGRAVFYDIDEVASYTINVSQNGYSVTSKDAEPGETVRIKLNDVGAYQIGVSALDSNGNEIAGGSASVTLALGDGYKNVLIDIEPYEKNVGINLTAAWETPDEWKYGAEDAVRYDVYIYEGETLVNTYTNVSLTKSYNVPFYSTYTVKIEAKKADMTVVGSGEATFTIAKGDTYKNVSITIVGDRRKTITFGSWPQSLADVTGITLTATGKTYDGSNAEFSGDDGNKYIKVGDSYYKVEPITWRVIAYNSDGSKKLLADKIYTNLKYYGTSSDRDLAGTTIYASNYKYSNIRAYLNSIKNQFVTDGGIATEKDIDWTNAGFLTTAFTDAEVAKIKTVTVDNSDAENGSGSYACENTEDKVYLLSYYEANKKLYGLNNNSDRIMKTTAYARANGAYQSDADTAGGFWWLRSPYDDYYARGINYDGSSDYDYVSDVCVGVVPALTVTE